MIRTVLGILVVAAWVKVGCGAEVEQPPPKDHVAQEAAAVARLLYNQKQVLDDLVAHDPAGIVTIASNAGYRQLYSARTYPADYAVSMLGVYLVSKDSRYAELARRQFKYARSLIHNGKCLVVPYKDRLNVTRDSLARYISAFYLGYATLQDRALLLDAEDQLGKLIDLKRTEKKVGDRTYRLYHYVYDLDTLEPVEGAEINPNQDAETALALALLWSDKASHFYHQERVAAIIADELNAAQALNDERGRLLSAESEPVYLADYAAYTIRTLCMTTLVMPDVSREAFQGRVLDELASQASFPRKNSGASLDLFVALLCRGETREQNLASLRTLLPADDQYVGVAFLRYIAIIRFILTRQGKELVL